MKRHGIFPLLCECLSFESEAGPANESLREKLGSGAIEWESLAEAASHHLVSPALYWVLRRKQLLSCIPADLSRYLETLYENNAARNRRIVALATNIIGWLNEVAVEPILLKGIGNVAAGLYPDPGMRVIGDIDLLVPEESIPDCVKKLQAAGYDPYISNSVSDLHVYLRNNDEYVAVELHWQVVAGRFRTLLDADAVLRDSRPLRFGDTHARIPSADHRVIHNVIHTQLVDNNYVQGFIRLRQLYDFVLLGRILDGAIDWQRIALLFERKRCLGALSGYMLAGERLLGHPMRPEVHVTQCAKLYMACVLSQNRWLWLMRAGSVVRLVLHFFRWLRHAVKNPTVPAAWQGEWWAIKGRRIAHNLRRRW